jgi:hypothetical protein
MLDFTTQRSGRRRSRAHAVLRLIGLAATYQRPGMPIEHVPPLTGRTRSLDQDLLR